MTAEILSVGTELLLGQIVDTHAPRMARILADCGISCMRRTTVGDNLERVAEAVGESLAGCDVLVTIGGLGPTMDDVTRDAIAQALGDRLIREADVESRLRQFFASRGAAWSETIARQADRPESAQFIENPNGTAPGLVCEKNGKTVFALPGPKGEFNPMADGPVRQMLGRLQGGQVIHSRVLRIVGMGESHVEDLVRDLMSGDNPSVAPYAHPNEVHLRLTARSQSIEGAEKVIEPVDAEIRRRLGDAVFGVDDVTLEEAVVELLRECSKTVGVAESITGGEICARITNVPGCSEVFAGGFVTYALEAKIELLGVPKTVLERFGPVSSETAQAMAEGARERLGTDFGLGVTGNAGPTSDIDGKPVGLVYVAVASSSGVEVFEHRFRGLREDIRRRASQAALAAVRGVARGQQH